MVRAVMHLALAVAAIASACSEPADPPPPGRSPLPEPPETTSPAGPLRVGLRQIATLEQPLALATRPDDPTLYIAQKTGELVALRSGDEAEVLLELEVSEGSEQGLLGAAFSPDGRFLYVNYTDVEGDTRIEEYAVDDRGDLDPASRREVLFVDQPFSNHNGGNLVFGPDGYLYVGLGDGGGAGDPLEAGQDLGTLLGKMLRIDPRPANGLPYSVPSDNPFVGTAGARPEIWAYGLRNPWRYSFDRGSGDLWIGDVGQAAREEIDRQHGGSPGGENYGWDAFEGDLRFEDEAVSDAVAPVHDYGRDEGASVVGGYVYRGSAIPGLRGQYLFADFYKPEIRRLVLRADGSVAVRELGLRVPTVASFAEDQAGELYVLSLAGPVYRLTG